MSLEKAEQLQDWAAKILQRHWRGRKARDAARELREKGQQEEFSSLQIQRVVRGHFGRLRWQRRWKQRRDRHLVSIELQRHYRGMRARKYANWWKEVNINLSAVVQRVSRGHLGRMEAARQRAAIKVSISPSKVPKSSL